MLYAFSRTRTEDRPCPHTADTRAQLRETRTPRTPKQSLPVFSLPLLSNLTRHPAVITQSIQSLSNQLLFHPPLSVSTHSVILVDPITDSSSKPDDQRQHAHDRTNDHQVREWLGIGDRPRLGLFPIVLDLLLWGQGWQDSTRAQIGHHGFASFVCGFDLSGVGEAFEDIGSGVDRHGIDRGLGFAIGHGYSQERGVVVL